MSKDTLGELLAQKQALEAQIAQVQRSQRADAIAKVKSLMAEYGLTQSDLGGKPAATPKAAKVKGKVAAKYRDPASGDTWSGRGLKPRWLSAALAAGRTLSDFAI